MRVIEMTGRRFGRLVVIGRHPETRVKDTAWLCQCDCGNTKIASGRLMRTGSCRSCGCLRLSNNTRRTHGLSDTEEHKIWMGIRRRCLNPNDKLFRLYGGRGVTVCERWLQGSDGKAGFACFLDDMGKRPSKQHSVDRIDCNGNYEPDNCRWATMKEQSNNRRNNVLLTFDGRTQTVAQWAREWGKNVKALYSALYYERQRKRPRIGPLFGLEGMSDPHGSAGDSRPDRLSLLVPSSDLDAPPKARNARRHHRRGEALVTEAR